MKSTDFKRSFVLFEQRAECGQVGSIFVQISGLGRLEASGCVGKSGIIDDVCERPFTDQPMADMVMPIDSRVQICLRVIEVKRQHLLQADHLPHLGDRGIPALARANVVTGGEEMRCVETNS